MPDRGRACRQGPFRHRVRDQHPPDRGSSDRGRQGRGRKRQDAARPLLRPLRRAAGRPARHVGGAAVCAAHRHAARRPQDHRCARRLRRQRPGDDLRRGLPRVQGGHRPIAAADHHDDRGRGGVRLEPPVRLRRGQCRRAQGRPRASLRHQHVGPGDADGDHVAARPRLRGGAPHLRRPGSPFRPVRRRGAEPAARAVAHLGGDARRQRPRRHSRLLRRREGPAARHQGGSPGPRSHARKSSWAASGSRCRRARRTAW